MTTFSVLLGHGAPSLDPYRPGASLGERSLHAVQALLERQNKVLDLDRIEPLGETTMGWVFRARQASLDRLVEVNVGTPPICTPTPPPLRRQASKLAHLDLPGVQRVFACGTLPNDGTTFTVLEWIDGTNLADLLPGTSDAVSASARAMPQASWRPWVERLADVAQTIAAAHERGIVHGDLTPRSIVLPRSGRPPVVRDWSGYERVLLPSQHADQFGLWTNVDYRCPEALRHRDLPFTTAADLWGLAAILYHAVTGVAPLLHHGDARQRLAVLGDERRPSHELVRDPRALVPDLPADLAALLDQTLRAEPTARCGSARAMATALQRLLAAGTDAAS